MSNKKGSRKPTARNLQKRDMKNRKRGVSPGVKSDISAQTHLLICVFCTMPCTKSEKPVKAMLFTP